MALIGNYSLIHKSPGRFSSGATISQVRSNFSKPGSLKNSYMSFGKLTAYPVGYSAPYAWSLPMTAGGMSSFTLSSGSASYNADLAGGRNLESSVALSITKTNAQLDQIVTFVASALLQLSTSADMNAAVQLQASAVLAITTDANIGAIVDSLASSSMAVTPVAVLTALAHMNAEAGGPTELSPEGLAAAVWSSDISGISDAGTAGLKLNNASSAGNPWEATLSTNNTDGTFGYLVQKLLTVSKFLGLK